ncbi:MAG: hypothetical protein IKG14_03485 [Clostridia bacterium]|nr:hypothetical protein [Clostridia bacterium]
MLYRQIIVEIDDNLLYNTFDDTYPKQVGSCQDKYLDFLTYIVAKAVKQVDTFAFIKKRKDNK